MILCIDYDDTYTRDPPFFDAVAQSALDRGHRVYCVSARHHGAAMDAARDSIGKVIGRDNCIGTNGAAKRNHLFKVYGVYGDVWIDDMPDTVTVGYDLGEPGWVTQYDGTK